MERTGKLLSITVLEKRDEQYHESPVAIKTLYSADREFWKVDAV